MYTFLRCVSCNFSYLRIETSSKVLTLRLQPCFFTDIVCILDRSSPRSSLFRLLRLKVSAEILEYSSKFLEVSSLLLRVTPIVLSKI